MTVEEFNERARQRGHNSGRETILDQLYSGKLDPMSLEGSIGPLPRLTPATPPNDPAQTQPAPTSAEQIPAAREAHLEANGEAE